jgi:MFS superfamily sulfate permease-like transporter
MQQSSNPMSPEKGSTQRDLSAGIVIFLVALPLCLGIALASGAPLFSGIIAGVVGGLIITPLSGSPLSVSGPAAGLAVIISDGIATCGSFSLFSVAVILAGAIQIILGVLHLGRVGELFPSSVIKGMLAGIGIVIVLKQIPHALGRDTDYEGDLAFRNLFSGDNTASEIAKALQLFSFTATCIAIGSLAAILIWDKVLIPRFPSLRAIPSALLAVIFGTAVHELVRIITPQNLLDPSHLVQLPIASNLAEWRSLFTTPTIPSAHDLSTIFPLAITIAVIASLETLLSVEAVDKIDPLKRISNTSKELIAQGVGNITSGCIGGLPMTAVIVRSSANVYAGGRTKLAAFSHGLFLLVAVITIPSILNRIPLASLAAILIMVGIKLAHPQLLIKMWKSGVEQFLPFIATVLAVVFSDLLVGVLLGLCIGLFFVLRRHRARAIAVVAVDNSWLIRFNKDLSFIHRSELKEVLLQIPNNTSLLIDCSAALYVDADIRELLDDFSASAQFREIALEMRGVKN